VFATDKVDVSGSSIIATDLDIRDLVFATDKVDVSGSSVTVTATNLDIRDLSHSQDSVKIGDGTDFLAINGDGSINVIVSDNVPGTPKADYQTSAAVAAAASVNHDYTVTAAMTFKLLGFLGSASGRMKIELKVETGVATGIYTTKYVAFTSTASPSIHIAPSADISVAAGVKVRLTLQNRDLLAQDLYSTLEGYEV
jgi:hypothetical protein